MRFSSASFLQVAFGVKTEGIRRFHSFERFCVFSLDHLELESFRRFSRFDRFSKLFEGFGTFRVRGRHARLGVSTMGPAY